MARPDSDPRAAPAVVQSVGELTRSIAQRVAELGRVSVEGEVSRVTRAASGHVYFDLKDADAKLSCKVWRSQVARAFKEELRQGDQVIVHGKLDVYAPQGSYSLIVERVEAAGLGALLLRLEELRAELRERGWFDRARALPSMPRRIGVVTSRDGAALQDFLRTRSQRWPLYPVRLVHAPVQGPAAAPALAEALRSLDASGVDVIVLCRGGGSLEDLWAFNELVLAEAIWAASVPVVSGVGHETDLTLADQVADVRAHTPTDAAQRTIPERAACEEALERAAAHMAQALDVILEARVERLARLARARVLAGPEWMVEGRGSALARAGRALGLALTGRLAAADARRGELSRRLERASPRRLFEARVARTQRAGLRLSGLAREELRTQEQRTARAAARLQALSPVAILKRGYSITTRRGESTPLTRAGGLVGGDQLETRFHDGRVTSRVEPAGPEGPGAPRTERKP